MEKAIFKNPAPKSCGVFHRFTAGCGKLLDLSCDMSVQYDKIRILKERKNLWLIT